MAAARPIPAIAADLPFGEAAALTVGTRGQEIWEHAHRALVVEDPEGVHDMRVATRRLRAALEVFSECFPRKLHASVLADVKKLADALGERRDPDVLLDALAPIEAALGRGDRAGPAAVRRGLLANQADANASLERALAAADAADLRGRIEALVAQVKT